MAPSKKPARDIANLLSDFGTAVGISGTTLKEKRDRTPQKPRGAPIEASNTVTPKASPLKNNRLRDTIQKSPSKESPLDSQPSAYHQQLIIQNGHNQGFPTTAQHRREIQTALRNKEQEKQPVIRYESNPAVTATRISPVSKETDQNMSTQRKRADRGIPRSSGTEAGEEKALWDGICSQVQKTMRLVQRSEEGKQEIFDLENTYKTRAENGDKPSVAELDVLSSLYREQVRLAEEILAIGRNREDGMLTNCDILKAVTENNESQNSENTRRGGNSRDGMNRSTAEADTAADSPAPSPIVDKPTRKGLGAGRSSLPPKESPMRQETAESGSVSGVEVNAKGKIIFPLGAEVAFRPKAPKAEVEMDWIQGVVVKVIGQDKSRRYDVQDPEPDENTKKPGTIYRTSASSMVTIPPLGQPLADYQRGQVVLARYPDTTTFYRAEVVGMDGSMVNLKFEGDDGLVTKVDRRFVLDHRGA